MLERIPEISRDLGKVRKAMEIINSTTDEAELRDAWEQYLIFWKRCLDKMIAGAKKSPTYRAWSHKINNLVQREDDEGVAYLWEARNVEDHGVGPFAPIRPGYTELGHGIVVLGNSEVEERGNLTIGPGGYSEFGNRTITTRNGVVTSVSGDNADDVFSVGPHAALVPIYSEAKRKVFPVPASIGGKAIPGRSAATLAKLGHGFLVNLVEEYLARATGKI